MRSLPFVILTLLCVPATISADAPPESITVGVSAVKPMVSTSKDGTAFTGFDIDVMAEIARRADLTVTYRAYEFDQLIGAVEAGKVDAAMAGISITAEREGRIDFSQSYLDSGLQILVDSNHIREFTIWDIVTGRPFLMGFGQFVLLMIAVMAGLGLLLWITDHGSDALDDRFVPGIFQGMWLAIVTSSTVGYGDVVPKKWVGKLGAAVCIILGTILFSVNSGMVAARMTTQSMQADYTTLKDLRGKRVATMRGTTSEAKLHDARTRLTLTASVEEAVRLLKHGKVDAVVYDAPVLRYYAHQDADGNVAVSGDLFDRQPYGIALPTGSPLRERFDTAILGMREDGTLDRISAQWFGTSD